MIKEHSLEDFSRGWDMKLQSSSSSSSRVKDNAENVVSIGVDTSDEGKGWERYL